jgi:DnaJ family protein C protein 2
MSAIARRCITYDPSFSGESEIYSTYCAFVKNVHWEAAGHAHRDVALLQAGVGRVSLSAADSDGDGDTGVAAGNKAQQQRQTSVDFSSLGDDDRNDADFAAKFSNRKKKTKTKTASRKDLYALLGLQHERWMASEHDIRKAYRKAALEHHPDKKRAASQGDLKKLHENEERFKAIQDAYETLSDPSKRREFDSLDPFDDSLPDGAACGESPEEFIRQFSAAFARNSKWSVKQPVAPFPESLDAADEVVDRFYSFWFSFKSWREFPHPDEEDVEQAESRYERRWIEKHNAKLREEGRKAEVRRMNEFVDLAHRLDPRMRARREREREERERAKAEKALEKKKREEAEEARRVEEERQRQEAEEQEKQAKKQRQFDKKALQKERAKLRKQVAENPEYLEHVRGDRGDVSRVTDEQVEKVCGFLNLEELAALNGGLTPSSLAAAVTAAERKEQEELEKKAAAVQNAVLSTKKEEKEALESRLARLETWSEEEVRLLNKAIDKFPPGTSRRWETVQLYLRTRTVDEILDMVKYGLKSGKFLAPTDRVVIAEKKKNKLESREGKGAGGPGGGSTAAPAAPAAPAATQRHESFTDVQVEVWTKEDELALVKALKEYGKDLGEERWNLVAKAVGKDKVACAKKFKEMKV